MSEFSPKERFDATMAICEHHVERFRLRQAHEWKLSFGLWALLITALAYVHGELSLPLKAILIAIGIAHIYWTYLMSLRNFHEMRRAYFYRDWSEYQILKTNFSVSERVPTWKELQDEERREIKRDVLSSSFV